MLLGGVLPLVLLAVGMGNTGLVALAAVLVLAGLLAYEWCFVMAAQSVPNS